MSNVPHCKIIEDMLNEVVKMQLYQIALKLLASGKLTEEEIAKATQLTLEEVKELKEQASPVTA